MGSYRHFLILLVVFLWPALAYAHGGLEAFVLKLAVFGYPSSISKCNTLGFEASAL